MVLFGWCWCDFLWTVLFWVEFWGVWNIDVLVWAFLWFRCVFFFLEKERRLRFWISWFPPFGACENTKGKKKKKKKLSNPATCRLFAFIFFWKIWWTMKQDVGISFFFCFLTNKWWFFMLQFIGHKMILICFRMFDWVVKFSEELFPEGCDAYFWFMEFWTSWFCVFRRGERKGGSRKCLILSEIQTEPRGLLVSFLQLRFQLMSVVILCLDMQTEIHIESTQISWWSWSIIPFGILIWWF